MSNGRPPTYLTTFHGELFFRKRATGKFKEPYKIEEEVIRERATGKFKELLKFKEPYKIEEEVGGVGILSGSVGDLGQNRGRFVVDPWSIWGRI